MLPETPKDGYLERRLRQHQFSVIIPQTRFNIQLKLISFNPQMCEKIGYQCQDKPCQSTE